MYPVQILTILSKTWRKTIKFFLEVYYFLFVTFKTSIKTNKKVLKPKKLSNKKKCKRLQKWSGRIRFRSSGLRIRVAGSERSIYWDPHHWLSPMTVFFQLFWQCFGSILISGPLEEKYVISCYKELDVFLGALKTSGYWKFLLRPNYYGHCLLEF